MNLVLLILEIPCDNIEIYPKNHRISDSVTFSSQFNEQGRCSFQWRWDWAEHALEILHRLVIFETCRPIHLIFEVEQQLQGRRFGGEAVCGIPLFSQSRAMASNLFAENSANLHLYRAKFCLKSWFVKECLMHSSHARCGTAENEFPRLSSERFASPLCPPTCYSLSWFDSSFIKCKIPPKIGLPMCIKECPAEMPFDQE